MAALSSNIAGGRDSTPDPERFAVEVENAETIYQGALVGLNDLGNATSADRGRAAAYANEAGQMAIGFYDGLKEPKVPDTFAAAPTVEAVGNTSADIPPGIATYIKGEIRPSLAVSGVASIADVGRLVYASTDNDFTLTPTARPDPIGVVTKYRSSGVADVYRFGFGEYAGALRPVRIPVSQRNITATGTSGNLVTGFQMPCKGLLLAVGYEVGTQITGSPDTVINAEFGGTNVTGGTVALAAAAVGTYNVGTSFATAGHYFSRGTLLDLEISGSAGASAGAVYLFVDVIPLSGS